MECGIWLYARFSILAVDFSRTEDCTPIVFLFFSTGFGKYVRMSGSVYKASEDEDPRRKGHG